MFPPLVETDTWALSETLFARVVRVAPKSGFPAHTGMMIKVLRGETNEVPTPLAPCKAVRSCKCPDYIKEVIAGSEGAILLVVWEKCCASELVELELRAKPVEFSVDPAAINGSVVRSFSLLIVEGETYVGAVQFHRASVSGASSEIKRYDTRADGLFGEIALQIEGTLRIEWNRLDDAADAPKRVLKVPAGYEYGPFYAVNPEGYLERSPSGQLVYAPHQYQFDSASSSSSSTSPFAYTWATVRLPVVKADVAGPHRHCYT